MLEIYKFQTEISNRYAHHLEKELSAYQSAVNEIIAYNPILHQFFGERVHLKDHPRTQKYERGANAIRSRN